MVKLIGFIEKYKEIVTFIAIIPVFSVFTTQLMLVYSIYKKIMPIIVTVFSAKTLGTVRALGGLLAIVGRTFVAGGIIAGLKSTLQLLSMMSPHLKALLILVGLVTGAVALYKAVFGKGDDAAKKSKLTNEQIHKQQQKAILDGYKITEQAVQKAKDDKTALDNIKKNAAAQKKAADKAKIDAKYAADYAKINASIAKKAGSKLLSGDDEKMVQINAADALLDRQLKNDALNKEMLKRLKEEISLLSVKNDLSIRYDDILKYLLLTQDKLPAAITVLAAKWGISQEAVKAYILQYQNC